MKNLNTNQVLKMLAKELEVVKENNQCLDYLTFGDVVQFFDVSHGNCLFQIDEDLQNKQYREMYDPEYFDPEQHCFFSAVKDATEEKIKNSSSDFWTTFFSSEEVMHEVQSNIDYLSNNFTKQFSIA